MPISATIKYTRFPNGIGCFYQHWIPARPKALVVFVHNLGDHICRYSELTSYFTKREYAVALYDQRGHGLSGGRRGHIRNFDEWVDDLAGFIGFSWGKVPDRTPLFILGVGTGALVGMKYLIDHAPHISGIVAVSTPFKWSAQMPPWKEKTIRRVSRIAPWFAIGSGIRPVDMTRDGAVLKEMESDVRLHQRVSLSATMELERNREIIADVPQRIHAPMLLLAGACDRICDPEASRRFVNFASSADKECRIYPDMYHDLLHDMGNMTVISDIEGWISKRSRIATPLDKQFVGKGGTIWEDASSRSL